MTSQEWLAKVKDSEDDLIHLINAYHPSSKSKRVDLPITAQDPEEACEKVRQMIREQVNEIDPVSRFRAALGSNDFETISNLLAETWFGVPESTLCWQIRGFAEAVELIDDPPEEDESNA